MSWPSLVAGVCGQIGVFAVTLQVFMDTGSSAAVGAIGLFVAAPTIVVTLLGGALADVVDRRKLMLATSAAQMVIAAGFVWQAGSAGTNLWVVYALVAGQSAVGALGVPTRRAFHPTFAVGGRETAVTSQKITDR